MKKKTNAEFLSEVYELVGNDYVFNEEYLTAVKKVSVTHRTCRNTYEVAPNKFLTGRRCPKCSRKTASIKMGKTKSMNAYQEMCEKVGMDFKEWLIERYYDEEKPTREISELLYGTPTNSPNVLGWMEKLEIPSRSRSDAVALQWKDNHERRKKQAEITVKYLGNGTKARKKLIKTMQTPEYRLKASMAKRGPKNPMYGVTGENHPNYNPNLTDSERKKQRKIEGYHNWRKVVYKRDGYACVYCGDSVGGNLVAHHLNGYHWDKKGRVDIKNGVTLCENCHKSFHTTYGYKENTKEQFNEFFLGV